MSHSFQFRIEEPDAGRRLDEFFALRFGGLSRMRITSLIEAGACMVNGIVGKAGYRVLVGDAVDVSFEVGAPTSMSPEPIPLEVIYEDEYLIVVVKPAGMLVHPTMSIKTGTLANALAYHFNKSVIEDGGWTIQGPASDRSASSYPQPATRPGMVHRLDRATSGLIVIAKTSRTLAVLSRHFRKRLVVKRYLALVSGSLSQQEGSICAPIGRDPEQRPRWRVMAGGKDAETRFKVVEQMPKATLVELEPVTGRTNQLRIHCAHIGHPIVGDEMYENCESRMTNLGSGTESQSVTQQSSNTDTQIDRLCLHAARLAFHHPAGGEWMEFTSLLPDGIIRIVDQHRD